MLNRSAVLNSTRLLLLAAAIGLLGGIMTSCGSSPGGSPGGTFPNVTGNWQFLLDIAGGSPPALPTHPVLLLSGSLSSSGGAVTGILHAIAIGFPPCIDLGVDILASGKIDSAGNVTLTAPISGGVATITLSIPLTPVPITNGTYQVIGGACAQPSSGLEGYEVANVSGIYKGTLSQLVPAPTGIPPTTDVTAVFVEATSPDTHGFFSLSGTITATGSCVTTLTFTQGVVYGSQLQTFPLPSPLVLPSATWFLGAVGPPTLVPQSQILVGTLFQPAGCPGKVYGGHLTH